MAVSGRTRETRCVHDGPARKAARAGEALVCRNPDLFLRQRQDSAGESPCGADTGWLRHPGIARSICFQSAAPDDHIRPGPADCVREYCEPAAGARDGTQGGAIPQDRTRGEKRADHPATADRKRVAGGAERGSRAGRRLRWNAAGSSAGGRRPVVLQAAMSLMLLAGAGLFSQSLNKLQHTNLRLDARNRYIAHINPQAAGYAATQLEALYRTIEQRFHELPGVKKVGISLYTPMEDNNWGTGVQVQGQPSMDVGAS